MSIEALRKKKRNAPTPAEVNGRAEIGRITGSHVLRGLAGRFRRHA